MLIAIFLLLFGTALVGYATTLRYRMLDEVNAVASDRTGGRFLLSQVRGRIETFHRELFPASSLRRRSVLSFVAGAVSFMLGFFLLTFR